MKALTDNEKLREFITNISSFNKILINTFQKSRNGKRNGKQRNK